MNLDSLKAGFFSYLQEKLIAEGNGSISSGQSFSDISIFAYGDEFKEYLSDELNMDISIFSQSVSDILSGKGSSGSEQQKLLNDVLNEFLSEDNVLSVADKDGDGKISDAENAALLKLISEFDMDNQDISLDDILGASDAAKEGKLKVGDAAGQEVAATEGAAGVNPTGSPSGTGDVSSPGGGNYNPPQNNNDLDSNANLETMTLEQLEQEKAKRQTNLEKAAADVNAVHSGENAAVKAAQQDADKAKLDYDEMVNQLAEQEVISAELKEQRDTNLSQISLKESEISGLKQNITDTDSKITTKEGEISSCESSIDALEAALDSYDSASDKDSKKKSEIESKKAEIRAKIASEKQRLAGLQQDLETLESEKAGYETDLGTAETDLANLNTAKTEIEAQLLQECEMKMPEMKQALADSINNYNTAKSNVDNVKTTELEKANSAFKTAQADLKEVNKVYDEKSASKIKGENGYNNTAMKNLVNYFGEDYLSVLSQDEINRIIKMAETNKIANIYDGWESKCLQAAWKYEEWATGNGGKANPYESADLDSTIAKMAESLNSGSPLVAKVNTQKGSRHFVFVIGIKQGASEPYKQSDFLCIDSYDGQVDGMGGSGNVKGNYRTLYAQNGQYWIGSRNYKFV